MWPWLRACEFLEHRRGHRGRELLGREPVPHSDRARQPGGEPCATRIRLLDQGRHHVPVERLAERARLLRPVEDGDRSHRLRQRGHQCPRRERPEQSHLHQADAFALRAQTFDGVLGRPAPGAHHHEHALGVGRTHVLEEPHRAPGPVREAVHRLLDRVGHSEVERVGSLPCLEEHVRVLRAAAEDRPLRRERALPVRRHAFRVHRGEQVVVIERSDLGHLVRGPEAIEEVKERDPGPQRDGVRDQREVLRLLHGRGAEHREAGRTRGHHVAVIAEDRQRVRRDRSSRDVHHEGGELSGDLEHVGQHQEQPLRGREGRGERPGLERAVERSGRAALALHLDHLGDDAPQVRATSGGPGVGVLAHRRGRRDRIDRDHIGEPVGNGCDGLVPVDRDPSGVRRPRVLHL